MPIGSRHDETGWLDGDEAGPVLRRDGGGRWRLDGAKIDQYWRGRRVRVVGTRIDFDVLAVARVEPLT